MQFTDRNKQFIKNYRINKVDTGESILAEITRNQSDENLSAPLNKGTLINAELLNGMFAAKQNKVISNDNERPESFNYKYKRIKVFLL